MTKFSLASTYRNLAGIKIAVLAASLLIVAIVACSSSDDAEPTATNAPEATQPPVATQAPDPTPTQTGGDTPVEPTKAPAPTATVAPTQAPAPTATPQPTVAPTATPDPFVTLVLLATGQVDPNQYPEVSPGDGELLGRLYPDAPPHPPHKVSDIRITLKSNQCLTCHEGGFASGGHVATGIPLSHYTDQYTLDVSNDLDPRRYICTTCHVPQVLEDLPYAE